MKFSRGDRRQNLSYSPRKPRSPAKDAEHYNPDTQTLSKGIQTGLGGVAEGSFEAPLTFADSVERTGNTISLENDSGTPGNSKYYGTNGAGARGYYDLPGVGAETDPEFTSWLGTVTPANWDTAFDRTTADRAVTAKTADYTAQLTDYIILVDATSGAVVITLPTAVGNSGKKFSIKKTDSSANTVTVQGDGVETIDGDNTLVIVRQYDAPLVVSNGTSYHVI